MMALIQYSIIIIIQLITPIILGFWLKSYLPSYFSQKGKNLANKEDIEELTTKIESVKKDFTKDLESFKNKLSFEREYKIKHKIEERDAIFKFWESICAWNTNIAIYKYENYKIEQLLGNPSIFKNLNECMMNTISTYSILQLKSNHEEILKLGSILYNLYNFAMGDLSEYFQKVENIKHHSNRDELFEKYRSELKEKLKRFYKNNKTCKDKFIKVAKKYLSTPSG